MDSVYGDNFRAAALDSILGKQSVRATFRLSSNTIDLLSAVASQLGVKQKSLFDHLVEDRGVLGKLVEEEGGDVEGVKIQKTYVISKNSLMILQSVASECKVSRDFLVERSIGRLWPVFIAEQEKIKKWLALQEKIRVLHEVGRELYKDADELLAHDDQVFLKLQDVVVSLTKGCEEIQMIINKGKEFENIRL